MRSFLVLIIAVACAILISLSVPEFGARDFVAFWCASKASALALNPYQASGLLGVGLQQCSASSEPQWFLNPPYALLALWPLSQLSFEGARIGFTIFNIFLVFGSAVALSKLWKIHLLPSFLSLLCFPAVWECLYFGQLSIVCLFSVCLSFYALAKNRMVLQVATAAICLLKPQITFLQIIYLNLRAPKIILRCFLFSLLFLSAAIATEFYLPGIWQAFLQREFSPLEWASSTLTTYVRTYLLSGYFAIALLPLVAMLGFFCTRFLNRAPEDPRTLCILSASSLIFAPYAWPFDFVLLAPLQVHLIVSSVGRRRLRIAVSLALIHAATLYFRSIFHNLAYMAFLPAFLVLVYAALIPESKTRAVPV